MLAEEPPQERVRAPVRCGRARAGWRARCPRRRRAPRRSPGPSTGRPATSRRCRSPASSRIRDSICRPMSPAITVISGWTSRIGARQRERADHPAGVGLDDRGARTGQVLQQRVVVLRAAHEHRPALDEHGADAVRADRVLREVEALGGPGPVHDVALAADIGVAHDDPPGRVGQHHRHRDVGEAVLEPVQHRHRRPTQHRDGRRPARGSRCGRARRAPARRRTAASSSRCAAARRCARAARSAARPRTSASRLRRVRSRLDRRQGRQVRLSIRRIVASWSVRARRRPRLRGQSRPLSTTVPHRTPRTPAQAGRRRSASRTPSRHLRCSRTEHPSAPWAPVASTTGRPDGPDEFEEEPR